jgi:hypothetical protein
MARSKSKHIRLINRRRKQHNQRMKRRKAETKAGGAPRERRPARKPAAPPAPAPAAHVAGSPEAAAAPASEQPT